MKSPSFLQVMSTCQLAMSQSVSFPLGKPNIVSVVDGNLKEKYLKKMNSTFQISFETNSVQPYKAVICIVIAVLIEIIGNGLLILVIVYEKFTMDPQKRTVINQLVSIACFIFLIQNIIGVPIMTYIIIVKDAGMPQTLLLKIICKFSFFIQAIF